MLEAAERAKDEGAADRSGSLLLREDLSAARSLVRTVLRLAVWTALLAPMGEEGKQTGWERGEEDGERRGKMRRKNGQRGERWSGKE